MKKRIILILALVYLSVIPHSVFAAVTITPVTGGSAISVDTTGGAYTALTGPVISEGVTADIGVGNDNIKRSVRIYI